MVDIKDYIEPVYDYLRSNAGKDDDTGTLVTHAPIHPWLMDTYGLTAGQAHHVRVRTVKALTAQGRVRRDKPRSIKVWILGKEPS